MAYGDGTITKRSDGRLQVVVTVDGKRRYATIPAKLARSDPREARRQAEKAKRELLALRDAAVNPSAQTLGDYLDSWIASMRDARRARIRPRTLDHYTFVVEKKIKPALGGIRLDRLNERQIQAWLDRDGGSPRSISHNHAVLRRALNVAVLHRVMLRNPALGVELPTIPEYRGNPLTIDEAAALLAATAGDRLGTLWRVALDTGFRISELLGLGWEDDIDLDAGTITPHRQLTRRRREWGYGPTKVARDLESVALDVDTVDALRSHKIRQAAERTAEWRYWGLVFVSPDRNRDGDVGMPYHEAAVLRAFHDACDRAGIPRRRIHDLRYSTSTLMRDLDVDEATRMSRLGHTTKRMARKYGQAGSAMDRQAARTLGDALRAAK